MTAVLILEKKFSFGFDNITPKTKIKRSLHILEECLLLDPSQGLYEAYRLPVQSRLDESLSRELL